MLSSDELYNLAEEVYDKDEYVDLPILKKPVLKHFNFFLNKDEIRTFPMSFSNPIMLEKERPARLCFIGKHNVFIGYIVDNEDFFLIDDNALLDIIDEMGLFIKDKCKSHSEIKYHNIVDEQKLFNKLLENSLRYVE